MYSFGFSGQHLEDFLNHVPPQEAVEAPSWGGLWEQCTWCCDTRFLLILSGSVLLSLPQLSKHLWRDRGKEVRVGSSGGSMSETSCSVLKTICKLREGLD